MNANDTAADKPFQPSEAASRIAGLDSLWNETTGDPEVCVAILDGPVDLAHPCFAGADLEPVETLVSGRTDGGPAAQHGTHVASIIFGRHGSPVRGIAPGCGGLVLPVFDDGPDGSVVPCSQIDLARAITRAVELGARVINVSGGQRAEGGQAHQLLDQAVRRCADEGVLIVAAAGNDGCPCLQVPAALPAVLAVGAMDFAGMPLAASNWGDSYLEQGLLAPGVEISGAVPGGGIARRSGTSFATAVVSGVVALLLSRQRRRGEPLSPLAIREALLRSATRCDEQPVSDCRRLLAGRLNIPRALSLLTTGGSMGTPHVTSGPDPVEPPRPLLPCAPAEPAGAAPPGVAPSGCGCGCSGSPQLVYVLGQIGHDFASRARRDSFIQQGVANPDDPAQLLAFLAEHPEHASAVTWLLVQETVPIYALQPSGAFAGETYERLREFLQAQLDHGVERVSIAGYLAGKVRLSTGDTVPVVTPELRGLYSWSTPALVAAVLAGAPDAAETRDREEATAEIANFLERIYYESRNLGLSSADRALNFAATNAFQVERVYSSAIRERLKLDAIQVERSPICRPESDCWDVRLTFFNPMKRIEQAREVYRFTVDVSDVVPVTVGGMRHWHVY